MPKENTTKRNFFFCSQRDRRTCIIYVCVLRCDKISASRHISVCLSEPNKKNQNLLEVNIKRQQQTRDTNQASESAMDLS